MSTHKNKPDREYVYAIKADSNHIKIGKSKNPKQRLRSLSTGTPHELELLAKSSVSNATEAEKRLHEKYEEYRTNGEWFKVEPDVFQEVVNDVEKYNQIGTTDKNPNTDNESAERYRMLRQLRNDMGGHIPEHYKGIEYYLEPFEIPPCDICGKHTPENPPSVVEETILCDGCRPCYRFHKKPDYVEPKHAHQARSKAMDELDSIQRISSITEIGSGDKIIVGLNRWMTKIERYYVVNMTSETITLLRDDFAQEVLGDGEPNIPFETYRLSNDEFHDEVEYSILYGFRTNHILLQKTDRDAHDVIENVKSMNSEYYGEGDSDE